MRPARKPGCAFEIGDSFQTETGRGSGRNRQRIAVVETERLADSEASARQRATHLGQTGSALRLQDHLRNGARVFGVDVDAAREQRLVSDLGAPEVLLVLGHRGARSLHQLGQRVAQDPRLGERLGADGDLGKCERVARREKSGAHQDGPGDRACRTAHGAPSPSVQRGRWALRNSDTNASDGSRISVSSVPFCTSAPSCKNRDLVRQERRFAEIVRNQEHRFLQLEKDAVKIFLEASADDRIERAERFIEQQDRRIEHQRAHQPHALSLAAGELGGVATQMAGGQAHQARSTFADGSPGARFSQPICRATSVAFSSALRWGKSPPSWMTYPMRRRSDCARLGSIGSPPMVIEPVSGVMRPRIKRSSVDLPDPLDPTSATQLSLSTVKLVGKRARALAVALADIREDDHLGELIGSLSFGLLRSPLCSSGAARPWAEGPGDDFGQAQPSREEREARKGILLGSLHMPSSRAPEVDGWWGSRLRKLL